MANDQPTFPYTDAQLETLTTAISLERLKMYIAAIKASTDPNDRLRKGIKLYEKNTAYCEAMYTVMQGFEVTFRNAIHNRLTADRGSEWWFDAMPLLDSEKEGDRRPRESNDRGKAATSDR